MNNAQSENQKQIVARIEAALQKLDYKPADIAVILVKLETSIQEEIGFDILASLPQETQDEITKIVEMKGDMNRLAALVPKLSKEEMLAKIEDKMQKAAAIFEEAAQDANTAVAKIQALLKPQTPETISSLPQPTS